MEKRYFPQVLADLLETVKDINCIEIKKYLTANISFFTLTEMRKTVTECFFVISPQKSENGTGPTNRGAYFLELAPFCYRKLRRNYNDFSSV